MNILEKNITSDLLVEKFSLNLFEFHPIKFISLPNTDE